MPATAIAQTEAHGRIANNLAIAALGVVYGDIGTSPLYAVKQCFEDAAHVSKPGVFGVLSLIVWSLTVIVTVKYVAVLMRADNRGEGGILALTVLAMRVAAGRYRWILYAGLFGAALFYGDGVITPAISVLSAAEGLKVATPALASWVLPLTLLLLVVLFIVQRRGTSDVGKYFGPVMVVWFAVIGLLGGLEIVKHPTILAAVNPFYAIELLL